MSATHFEAFTLKSTTGPVRSICFPVDLSNPLTGNSLKATALLDTGADISCVSEKIASLLSLSTYGQSLTQTAGGLMPVHYHRVNVILPKSIEFANHYVATFADTPNIEMLIGMDIITRGDLAITADNDNTVISFQRPHGPKATDYCQ